MICIVDGNNQITNIVNTDIITAENERQFYPWCQLWGQYTATEPLSYAQQRYISAAGAEFARKRDTVRFVELEGVTYGFDCASEDITNFFAAKDSLRDELDAWDGSGEEPKTFYKVWLTETEKGGARFTMEQLKAVQTTVRTGQLEAYAWYGDIKARLEAAVTKEELEEIFPMNGGND